MTIQFQARQTYLMDYLKDKHPKASLDDVSFDRFLGIYHGSLVAVFYGGQYHGVHLDVVREEENEGFVFSYPDGYPILVWKDQKLYTLTEAYGLGILTKDNLTSIYDVYYN